MLYLYNKQHVSDQSDTRKRRASVDLEEIRVRSNGTKPAVSKECCKCKELRMCVGNKADSVSVQVVMCLIPITRPA
jgi:hypothetical protein